MAQRRIGHLHEEQRVLGLRMRRAVKVFAGAQQHRLPRYNPGMETKSLYAEERSGDGRWAV